MIEDLSGVIVSSTRILENTVICWVRYTLFLLQSMDISLAVEF